MFKHLTLTFVFLFLVIANVAAQEQGGIVWEKDYKTALAKARETGRPLMIDFWAEWCKPCLAMDKDFWPLPEVVNAVKPLIAVKLNADDNKSVGEKFAVNALPNVVFADPLGNMVTSRKGFSASKVKELHQIFDEMPKDFSALLPLYDALDQKKNDGEALLKIADAYRAHKMLMLSNDFYRRALKDDLIKKRRRKTRTHRHDDGC